MIITFFNFRTNTPENTFLRVTWDPHLHPHPFHLGRIPLDFSRTKGQLHLSFETQMRCSIFYPKLGVITVGWPLLPGEKRKQGPHWRVLVGSGPFLAETGSGSSEKPSSGSLNGNLQSASTYSHQHRSEEVPKCGVHRSDLVCLSCYELAEGNRKWIDTVLKSGARAGGEVLLLSIKGEGTIWGVISTSQPGRTQGFCGERALFMDGITPCAGGSLCSSENACKLRAKMWGVGGKAGGWRS